MKRKVLPVVILVVSIVANVYFCWRLFGNHLPPADNRPTWMSDVMMSRVVIDDVKSFNDQSHIHGLRFFSFKTNDPSRIINLLGLRQQKSIPDIFDDRFRYLESKVNWKINIDRSEVYYAYYCNGQGHDWSVDLLLVSGVDVIYMTSGYTSNSAFKVDGYEKCHK